MPPACCCVSAWRGSRCLSSVSSKWLRPLRGNVEDVAPRRKVLEADKAEIDKELATIYASRQRGECAGSRSGFSLLTKPRSLAMILTVKATTFRPLGARSGAVGRPVRLRER